MPALAVLQSRWVISLGSVTERWGAKQGANTGRYWATPGHYQRPSVERNSTSGHTQPHRATCQDRLLSRRPQVRILLGTLLGTLLCSGRCLRNRDIWLASIERREAYVMGKGRRARIVPFSHQTARALDRYERIRKSHKSAHLPGYWLADRGGVMTGDGIDQAIRRRGRQAGIPDLHPHMFRHTFTHYSKGLLLKGHGPARSGQ